MLFHKNMYQFNDFHPCLKRFIAMDNRSLLSTNASRNRFYDLYRIFHANSETKCCLIGVFYFTSSFTILMFDFFKIFSFSSWSIVDLKIAAYLLSVILSALSLITSIFFVLNIARRNRLGLIPQIIMECLWLLYTICYALFVTTELIICLKNNKKVNAANESNVKQMINIFVLTVCCLFQLWLISTSIIHYKHLRLRRSGIIQRRTYSMAIRPPAYRDIFLMANVENENDQLPSYEEAVRLKFRS